MRKNVAIFILCIAALGLYGCGRSTQKEDIKPDRKPETEGNAWEEAAATPYAKYPETVIYTLAKMATENNSNMPAGDTYEDNFYTRLIKDVVNAQNENIYEGSGDTYNHAVETMIATGDIPDVLVVDEEHMYKMQASGMLEDLTDAYEKCASDRIKDIYKSYGDDIFDKCTFDGRLLAIPETNVSNGPNFFWLRTDYLEEVGMEEPKTIEDAMEIAKAFADSSIGCTASDPNVGLVCSTDMIGNFGIASEFTLELIFAEFDAYPKKWLLEDGKISYGSVSPNAREALLYLQGLYRDGVLDPDFLIRTESDIANLVVDGRCGAFFAPWWAPNNPLWKFYEKHGKAVWKPYLLSNTPQGTTRYPIRKKTGNYIVVRKGYEHPEVVLKILSVMFDYARYTYEDADGELAMYYQKNVGPSARPLTVNVDYNEALNICYRNLCGVLSGEKKEEELQLLEYAYYKVCSAYLENPEDATAEEWSGYMSRITACGLLNEEAAEPVNVIYPVNTKTMDERWTYLEELEKAAYLKIIRGEEDIGEFDKFVERWYREGGEEILEEINQAEH